jgi:hypothetical protein
VARLGRGFPAPVYIRNAAFRFSSESTSLGVFATASAFPELDVTSPSVSFDMDAFETASAFPAFTIDYDTSFTLPVFATSSGFPSFTVDVPILPGELITGDYQIEWARMVFGGAANVYQIEAGSVEGWDDMPELDSGNASRSQRHGSFPGLDFAQQRTVSATIAISETSGGFLQARRDLRRVINVSESGTELDLTIRTDGETLLVRAKPAGRVMPTQHYVQGWTLVPVRWICSDPRRYDLQQQSVTVAAGGTVTCTNDGDIATSPRIKIFGPVVNPVIHNETLDRILRFAVTLAGDEELEVDTHEGTVVDLAGEDAMDALANQTVPVEAWVLAAGSNQVAYSATSGGDGGIEILFRSAFM